MFTAVHDDWQKTENLPKDLPFKTELAYGRDIRLDIAFFGARALDMS